MHVLPDKLVRIFCIYMSRQDVDGVVICNDIDAVLGDGFLASQVGFRKHLGQYMIEQNMKLIHGLLHL